MRSLPAADALRGIELANSRVSEGSREGVIRSDPPGRRESERRVMDWIRQWSFWRRGDTGGPQRREAPARPAAPRSIEEWEHQLVADGVSADWAPRIAERLEPIQRELGLEASPALRRAAVTVFEAQAEMHAYVERNLRDVREVERLLGAFSGELEKLDEVLEVLAAYAQRMRAQPRRKARHTLH